MGEGSDQEMGKIKTCQNCLWIDSCEYPGEKCEKHTTLFERRDKLDFTLEDWEKFTKEWDEARRLVSKYIHRK